MIQATFANLQEVKLNNVKHALLPFIKDMNKLDLDKAKYKNHVGWNKTDSKYFHSIVKHKDQLDDLSVLTATIQKLWKYRKQFARMGKSVSDLYETAKKAGVRV